MAPVPSINLSSATTALSNLRARLPAALSATPTRTTSPSLWSRILSAKRSTSSIIPEGYGNENNSLAPGTVVGIVIGSVAGFLLLLWLIYTCLNFGGGIAGSTYTESVVVREPKRRSRHSGSHRSRRASETIEIRTHAQERRPPSRSPIRIVRSPSPPPPPRMERIIVEESRETRRAPSRAPSRHDSDEVVVIEEHSPPRRKKSHREREVREVREERDSGFRTVDPLAYGGVVGGNSRRGSRRRD